MPIKSKIKITPFTYKNGSKAFRVSGTVAGQQVRKNFKTREEATEAKQKLTSEQLNGETPGRSVWTTLSPEENRDAVTAVSKLKAHKSKKSLSFAVDFMLRHYSQACDEQTVKDAVTAYQDNKSLEETRGIISGRQLKAIKIETNFLSKKLGNRLMDDITSEDLEAYLNMERSRRGKKSTGFSMKTWNNRRGLLSTFFRFAYAKKWVGHNPVEDVVQYKIKHRRSTAETLTTEQTKELLKFLEKYTGPKDIKRPMEVHEPGFLVPYFVLGLFAGIRPDWRDGEMSKIRPQHIDMDKGVIRIEPEVSKVNERRVIKIQPNLKAWLKKYPLPESGALPRYNPERILRDVKKQKNLGHDVLRHTYISMLVGAFKSVGDAALQAGNSEAVIRRHYLDLKTENEAKGFWRIQPH